MMRCVLAAFVGLLCVLATPAAALKMMPFKAVVIAGVQGQSQVFRLENNTPESAAVEVRVMTWHIAEDGVEENIPAESDFAVFPAQLVLAPHESRAVRVQWQGKTPPAQEKAYRLVAEQLPVTLKDTAAAGSAVRFLLRFKGALYLRPHGTVRSDIQIARLESMADGRLALTLVNNGTAHAVMRRPKLRYHSAGQVRVLDGKTLAAVAGENIHAGAKRRFILPAPMGITTTDISSATFEYEASF